MKQDYDKTITVLLVEDDEDDYLILRQIFGKIDRSRYHLVWSSSYEDALDYIDQSGFDICMLDYNLGERTGLDLLKYAKPERRREPFILLTGARNREIEQQALSFAAADFLVKGTLDAELLQRALSYALGRKQVEAQRIQHLLNLNRAKDEFISLASHQLRTPATGVKQYIGMLLDGMIGELSPAQISILEKAYDSNERQLQIIADLLKVARVDAGKVTLKPVDVDLAEMIQDILGELTEVFEQRRQTVDFTPPQQPVVAHIDRATMRMVIENMVDNASKYSGPNQPITVCIGRRDREIFIGITDSGVGIAPSDRDKLFEKFSRIPNPLSTHVGGTGLGLYWAKRIVDMHGGGIEVESDLGKGSTFTVLLPERAGLQYAREENVLVGNDTDE